MYHSASSNHAFAKGTGLPASVKAGLLLVVFLLSFSGEALGQLRATRANTRAARSLPLRDLPFFADDLKPGERWSTNNHAVTTTQKYGYDLGVKRYISSSKTWSSIKVSSDAHWNNPKNSNYLIWGKPIYAMEAGEVIRCWRNAPQNPRPKLPSESSKSIDFEDREWLHQAWRDKLMPGGGNSIVIEHADGTRALYAHFQTGSIPASICPNNNALYSKADNKSESEVPVDKRAKIKRGQFLGRAGNSGNSTNPHLHIHLEKDGKAEKIYFKRGLATDNTGNKGNINNWTRFAGKMIPKGPVLVWPPLKKHPEYARHRYPAKDLPRLFDHLADSGYAPEWFDCYSVGGKTYYNFVWRPATGAWRAYFGQSSSSYQQRINKAKADGYAPVQVESCLSGGNVRYTAIFRKVSGAWKARHGITYNTHMAELNKAKQSGLSPINVSVVSVNGQRRYTVLYRKASLGAWQVKSQLDAAAYQQAVNSNKQAGRKPFYINTYMHKGKPYFSAIFAQKPSGSWRAKHGLTASSYQSEWKNAHKSGLLTRVVTGYDGAKQNHRFAALWRK